MAGFGILNDPAQANLGQAQQQSGYGTADQANATGLAALAANGQAPSAADAQMRAGLLQAQQAQQAAAASTRGNFGLAGAQKSAMQQGAGMQQQAINEAAARRAQEQAQARGEYINAAGLQRSAGLQQAGLTQQGELENAQLAQEQNQANQTMSTKLLGGGLQVAGSVLGGAAMFSDARLKDTPQTSDERLKQERPSGHEGADAFLHSLSPHVFTWKDANAAPNPQAAHNPNLGIMAQEVERSPAGHAIVQEDPSGYKKLDHAALLSAVAAGAGRLHERVSALEAMIRGGGR
jgi:hypothetical protein